MTASPSSLLPASARLVGTAVRRKEDPRLLTGRGRYVDDVVVPGMFHAHFLRSDVARGRITRLDVEAARGAPGVRAVLTAAELNPVQKGSMRFTLGADFPGGPPEYPLAEADVRFVGDPVVLIVATSRALAEDAAELVELDIEPLSAVVDYQEAGGSAELVHAELGTNVAQQVGVPPDDDLEEILRTAPHVVTETFYQQRYLPVPMEPRGILASWTPGLGEFRIWVSTQSPHDVRTIASRLTGVPEHQVRVTMGDVGGGFGQKAYLARDEQVIMLASFHLGVPIKWIEDRRENLIAATTARTERVCVRLAADAEGHLLGASFDQLDDVGAYPLSGSPGMLAAMMFPGPYRLPKLGYATASVYTNTCPRAPYRGPWQVETFAREQAMDLLARQAGLDPVELRRRNVIRRDELPHTMPTGITLVEVSPAETLDQAVQMVDYPRFRDEQRRALDDGRLLGIGFSLYIEPQPSLGVYGAEPCHIRIQPNGTVDVYVGSGSHGQGIETTTAQLVSDHLGVAIDDIAVHQGDTAETPYAFGTGGSRSGPVLGAAVRQASLQLREKLAAIAAHRLEAAPDDIEVIDSVAAVIGTPARSLSLRDLARDAYFNLDKLPPDMEPGLEIVSRYKAPDFMYSNACHVCVVEIDRATGTVQVVRYLVSEDCGVMINPAVVEGQIAGGVVQGIGGALLEDFVYDGDGNPLTTTFLDYLLPTAGDVPLIEYGHVETPATTPGHYKGVGEGGAIGAPPAVANAVNDALAQVGAPAVYVHPLTPPRILAALGAASAPPPSTPRP